MPKQTEYEIIHEQSFTLNLSKWTPDRIWHDLNGSELLEKATVGGNINDALSGCADELPKGCRITIRLEVPCQ